MSDGESGVGQWQLFRHPCRPRCLYQTPDCIALILVDTLRHNVIAVPTVIRALPAPIRKFVGMFADENGPLLRIDLTSPGDPS